MSEFEYPIRKKTSEGGSTLNPLPTIIRAAGAIKSEYDYPIRRAMDTGASAAKVVGSGLSAVIEPLSKPFGAAAGAWDVIGEYGPKITPEGIQGPSSLFERNEGSVMDNESFPERMMEGIKGGWKEPFREDLNPGDAITDFIPQSVKDVPYLGKTLETGTDIAASVGIDPLTYTPGAVLSIPYRAGKGIMKAVAGTKPVKSVLQSGFVTSPLEALNIYTGDAAKAQKIINDVRLENRGAEILSERQMLETNKELQNIADNAGVSLATLKQGILQATETADLSKMAEYGVDAVEFTGSQIKFYKDIINAEKAAGIGTADIMARGTELGIGGYVPHIRNDTLTARVKRMLSTKSGFMQEREIAGTIEEINAARGTKFFMDDPVALSAHRLRAHNQVMLADRTLKKAGQEFGVMVGKKKGMDINGNPLPEGWGVLQGHAYPPEIHRVLSKQYQLLKSPTMAKGLIKGFDEVQNWWKKYSLASRPAWHTRNAFGNFWNNYMLGGLTDFKLYGEAAAIQKSMHVNKGGIVSRLDDLAGIGSVSSKQIVKGTGMTREEIFNEAVKRGVYESGLYGQDLGEAALKSSNVPLSTEWSGINKAFAAGKAVENNARIALFIDGIKKAKKGGGPVDAERILDGAASNVRKSLFDYSDLSDIEKRYMKRLMPFYTWTRKNIPAQFRAIIEHPDRANKINLLVGNLQRGVTDLDETDVEQWVKGQFPIFLDADDNEQYRTFVTAMSYLPTAELDRLMRSPEQLGKMVGDMGSPILKLPFEMIYNYGSFKEDKIDPSQLGIGPNTGKFGEGLWSSLPGKTGSQDFLGLKVTPKQKHLLQAIVMLGEVDRLNPWNVFGDSETGEKSWAGATRHGKDILESSRWIRAILGARIYKREKGRAKLGAVTELMSDLKYLQSQLGSPKVQMNPDLRQHLKTQFEQILP